MRVLKRLLFPVSFAVIIFLAWLGWPWSRVAGVPAWLKQIGLLGWLAMLAPLDQWFIAFGTVSALVYAIFSETFLLWWRRPKLRVLFAEAEPFVIQIPILRQNSINPSIQSRILIRNDGKTRAESVGVYARRLYRRGEGDLTGMSWFIPMDLKWAEDEHPITAISVGVERTCNVIGIECPGQPTVPVLPGPVSMGGMASTKVPQAPQDFDYNVNCYATIQTPTVTSFTNLVFPGVYQLELVVSAANAKSQTFAFDFRFDGRWFSDRQEMIPAALSFSIHQL